MKNFYYKHVESYYYFVLAGSWTGVSQIAKHFGMDVLALILSFLSFCYILYFSYRVTKKEFFSKIESPNMMEVSNV